jgi:hypothetical protein
MATVTAVYSSFDNDSNRRKFYPENSHFSTVLYPSHLCPHPRSYSQSTFHPMRERELNFRVSCFIYTGYLIRTSPLYLISYLWINWEAGDAARAYGNSILSDIGLGSCDTDVSLFVITCCWRYWSHIFWIGLDVSPSDVDPKELRLWWWKDGCCWNLSLNKATSGGRLACMWVGIGRLAGSIYI